MYALSAGTSRLQTGTESRLGSRSAARHDRSKVKRGYKIEDVGCVLSLKLGLCHLRGYSASGKDVQALT